MESQDKRMCNTESVFGATVDCNAHRVYDEDFSDILNMLDFPMESLEGDGFAEDWASRLGPIPSEVFREAILPSGSQTGGANTTNNFGSYADLPFDYPVLNNKTGQQKYNLGHDEEIYKNYQNVKISQLQQQTTFVEERKLYPSQASFEAPSPNSVLESRSSSSSNKGVVSFGTEVPVPVRTRSKRVRPTANPWLLSPFLVLPNKGKKRKSPSQIPVTMEAKKSVDTVGVKKCAHCEITKTPQWREGPMGPKTLCNACGVRYRSGRLYPEYRPAASPTFVPALHSNSHRKVIEMRQKAVE
ncbi:putative transcription factor C2C2-GATA family [Helianthus annuus]|uniref:Putative GATA transcription factor 10 n=1 Tax=Helianthus annuus TaxID=4232 RepID=A0A251SKN9_HELAN|nr:GATA transcription factor 11 [Helianthus annuus]KAF5770183.1 putative transcription factor C2C2-GATA family [Helianthus annuus]KAJ0465130.1 putative transcription factor C2C2-GATA family [Helianthus annuus]KAJ0486721.1 putative transcription factor C2C2-GATA family [Helianthus annuus]KAJ0660853.1 putative transcription factor C2C2-GATA family [Helianthus annuus]